MDKNIIEDMQWFPIQSIMLHTSDKFKHPEGHLQSLLKVFSMFKIVIWYDETISIEDVPEAVGIMCIDCGKSIGCSLDNQTMEKFITPFVPNMLFQNLGLSWFIKLNQKLNFVFPTVLYFLVNKLVHGITL